MNTRKATIAFAALAAVAVLLVLAGYSFPWTGFGGYYDSKGDFQRGKTLWDWLSLLIIPLVLVFGAFLLNRAERIGQEKVESDRQHQSLLDGYFTAMTELLLKEKLRDSEKNSEVRSIARTLTLVTIRALDADRKPQALQFLYESGLIAKGPVISLNGAELSGGEFDHASLTDAELRGVYLKHAKFAGANFTNADLRGTDFSGANLTDARFNAADLRMCNLNSARMFGADFTGADLSLADLTAAAVSIEQLRKARSLNDVTMPDGSLYSEPSPVAEISHD